MRRKGEFAAGGAPGWPAYDTDERLVQLFDAQPTVTSYPERASDRIWRNHTFPPLPLIGR
ncbi:hypothetical protein ADK52_37805 [Streptomyces sp. WM6372]|uniref:hypothetical protein n=1 Tax=Streptomyces sp. WM6372 TaxID=1415555 RepID=UPI0006AE2DE3|nr:hypothetical protein [Streptomyces sp. WM6372]KOU13750.1 hypothetical protein ADK52_37805 [Streptomyces sp. WM6372]